MRTYAVRVIAGIAKGRRLAAPPGDTTRPTSDQVREAIFNVLGSITDLDGATVVDLFAGTGALGIEALSRGAHRCVFVEHDRRALDAIRANLDTTGFTENAQVVRADVARWLTAGTTGDDHYDVAFADPPYRYDGWRTVATVTADLLVAESHRTPDLGQNGDDGDGDGDNHHAWQILREKRYGSTVVTLFVPRSPT